MQINFKPSQLLILGCGYVGTRLAQACLAQGMRVVASTRNTETAAKLESLGIQAIVIQNPCDIDAKILAQSTHLLDSIPLQRENKHMFATQNDWLPSLAPKLTHLSWAGYLSSTGVYGDAQGAWVDETYHCQPSSPRGIERLKAEDTWLHSGLPVEIFRLAGIYGPERNLISRLLAGNYKAVQWQPAHYSSRIHVDDIISALLAAMQAPKALRIVNLADDLPLPHHEYVQQVAHMIAAPMPIILSPEEAKEQLSANVLSFFSDNKRIRNQQLHEQLLPQLRHPTFKQGIAALLKI